MTKDRDQEKILKALANRRRIAIAKLLTRGKAMTVGDVANEIRLSFRSTSKHLGLMVAADILLRDQRGPHMYYLPAPDMPGLARKVIAAL